MTTERTATQEAFRAACEAEARLYVMQLSGRGDKSAAFHAFAGAFRNLYNLTINNTKIRETTSTSLKPNSLTNEIKLWFANADNKNVDIGVELFREFNIALGQVGLL